MNSRIIHSILFHGKRIAAAVLLVIPQICAPFPAAGADLEKEVAAIIKDHAEPPPAMDRLRAFAASNAGPSGVRTFLASFDKYASLVTAEEFQRVLEARRPGLGSVGMDLITDAGKTIICVPYPGSPAEYAGIRYGDELLSVNGVGLETIRDSKVTDDHAPFRLDAISELIRGTPGTNVNLCVRHPDGNQTCVTCTRAEAAFPTAMLIQPEGQQPILRIFRFSPTTPRDIDDAMRELSHPAKTMVLDLRGNTGGDLEGTLETLRRFMPAKAVLLRTSRSGSAPADLKTTSRGRHAGIFLHIWQDHLTASAAEVCITALRQTNKAVSIGRRSAGKACVQTWHTLNDGSRLKLTTERLLFPDAGMNSHETWQDEGLVPDITLQPGEDYADVTAQLPD